MPYYQFVGDTPEDGAYFIQQRPGQGWTLWHLGKDRHLSLHYRDTAKEVEFDDAEAIIDYCAHANDKEDPQLAYFLERVFRGRKNTDFPKNLGSRKHWLKGVDSEDKMS